MVTLLTGHTIVQRCDVDCEYASEKVHVWCEKKCLSIQETFIVPGIDESVLSIVKKRTQRSMSQAPVKDRALGVCRGRDIQFLEGPGAVKEAPKAANARVEF